MPGAQSLRLPWYSGFCFEAVSLDNRTQLSHDLIDGFDKLANRIIVMREHEIVAKIAVGGAARPRSFRTAANASG